MGARRALVLSVLRNRIEAAAFHTARSITRVDLHFGRHAILLCSSLVAGSGGLTNETADSEVRCIGSDLVPVTLRNGRTWSRGLKLGPDMSDTMLVAFRIPFHGLQESAYFACFPPSLSLLEQSRMNPAISLSAQRQKTRTGTYHRDFAKKKNSW